MMAGNGGNGIREAPVPRRGGGDRRCLAAPPGHAWWRLWRAVPDRLESKTGEGATAYGLLRDLPGARHAHDFVKRPLPFPTAASHICLKPDETPATHGH
jgi:hypothetical protein